MIGAPTFPDISVLVADESLNVRRILRDMLARTPDTSPCPSIPLVLMISQARRVFLDRGVALGVNEVIAKPFSPKTLWSRLDEVVNRPRPYVRVKSLLRLAARRHAQ